MSLLEIDHVTKVFKKDILANEDISLSIEAGEVFGLLGPNGAGKTTLMNQIMGLAAPTSGTIRINGIDVVEKPTYARQACSYQPQNQAPLDGVNIRKAIELVGRIRGGSKADVSKRATNLLASLEMLEWADHDGARLSGGMKRLAAFCMATVVPGRLVILDEPTNDIDPLRRKLLWREVRKLATKGSAVLLVTHNVLEAERSVDRLAVINQGRVLASGTAASLKGFENGYYRLEMILEPSANEPEIPFFLAGIGRMGRRMFGRFESSNVSTVLDWAHTQKRMEKIEEYSIGPATLEDAYLQLIGRTDVLTAPSKEVYHELCSELV
ncbi:MAG: ABC transporter ATP-binding protein [Candidatus Promineifilaceae bacterium]|jgi:ABC-2 type transport system ATP-binding protein